MSSGYRMILFDDERINVPKPILKWVGGKTQIIDKILSEFPTEMENYREVFLGGGSVLLALLKYRQAGIINIRKKVYDYDVNEALIFVYKNIQLHYQELYTEIEKIIEKFNQCQKDTPVNRKPRTISEAMTNRENYYYWCRQQYNQLSDKTTLLASALFIFLNKTCFRGVYRVGPNGFNVPYGHYANPEIINYQHLYEIHHYIRDVEFQCADFSTSISKVQRGDFIYLDPPYAPEKQTSFVGYTENGFSIENHIQLFEMTKNINGLFLMSNSDVSFVRENFDAYQIQSILCKRSIHSKKPATKTSEVLIKNY